MDDDSTTKQFTDLIPDHSKHITDYHSLVLTCF